MTIPSAIAINAPIGQGILYYMDDQKTHVSMTVADLFREGTTVVFGGPAPFSRLDTEQALQYERACPELLSLGVDKVVAIYAQDAFVCEKFRELISSITNTDCLRYYGDGDGFFIRAYDLCRDFTMSGLGIRSERWCAVVRENVIQFVEHDSFSEIDKTHVDNIINWLKSK